MENQADTSPAGDALREQVAGIMADPQWGRNPALGRKVEQLYKDQYGTGTVSLSDGVDVRASDPASTPPTEARAPAEPLATSPDVDFQGQVDTALRDRWGVAHDAKRAELLVTMEHLFGGDVGGLDGKIFATLEERLLSGLSPSAEVQAHVVFAQFLDDLARLRQSQS